MATYDDEDDVVLVCSAVNMASAALLMCKTAMELEKQSKKRKHRVWVHKYLSFRPQYGAYNTLMRHLLELDRNKFKNYIRMDPDVFEELFVKVESSITAADTKFR